MRALLHSGGLLLRPEGLQEIADFLGPVRRVALTFFSVDMRVR